MAALCREREGTTYDLAVVAVAVAVPDVGIVRLQAAREKALNMVPCRLLLFLELAPRSCSCARHLFVSFLKLIKLKQGQETLERFNRAVVT